MLRRASRQRERLLEVGESCISWAWGVCRTAIILGTFSVLQ